MDIESRLRKLESRYRAALSASVAAKSRYLSLAGQSSTAPTAVRRAHDQWQQLESRKKLIVERMDAVERLEHDAMS
jgi:ABC-type transport system involved in cytochrome bd biosynthesis fused ATPase/permease subunit